jgi:hypothetical protein
MSSAKIDYQPHGRGERCARCGLHGIGTVRLVLDGAPTCFECLEADDRWGDAAWLADMLSQIDYFVEHALNSKRREWLTEIERIVSMVAVDRVRAARVIATAETSDKR